MTDILNTFLPTPDARELPLFDSALEHQVREDFSDMLDAVGGDGFQTIDELFRRIVQDPNSHWPQLVVLDSMDCGDGMALLRMFEFWMGRNFSRWRLNHGSGRVSVGMPSLFKYGWSMEPRHLRSLVNPKYKRPFAMQSGFQPFTFFVHDTQVDGCRPCFPEKLADECGALVLPCNYLKGGDAGIKAVNRWREHLDAGLWPAVIRHYTELED